MNAMQPGTVLGAYVLDEQIGHGAWSVVYKARRADSETPVAIKVLLSNLASQEGFVERFKREARAVAKLHHRNIVTLYEFDERDGSVYIAMEYIPGRSLGQMLRGPVPLEKSIDYCCQMADALQYAHQLGVIHRDIKPGNMMIEEGTGRLVLMDFGFSKIAEESLQLTRPGTNLGTPHFMSPEQILGKPVDQRTDIYAMGVVLYQLLTCKLPYASDNAVTVMKKVLQEPMPRPSAEIPTLSPALEDIVLKATAKRREDRYVSAAAMKAALREAWTPSPALAGASMAAVAASTIPRFAADFPEMIEETEPRRLPTAWSVTPAIADTGEPTREVAAARLAAAAHPAYGFEPANTHRAVATGADRPSTAPAPVGRALGIGTATGGRPSSLLSRSRAQTALFVAQGHAIPSPQTIEEPSREQEITTPSDWGEPVAPAQEDAPSGSLTVGGLSPNLIAMMVVVLIVVFFLFAVVAHH